MKVIVFVKQIPDNDNVSLEAKTGNLKRDEGKTRMNPTDCHAIEAAMELKRTCGAYVTAVSMGPLQASAVLKKAMALGCDDGYLLSDRAFGGADSLATAYTLAKAVEKLGGCDLILAGKNSYDGDTAQVGGAVAAFLDWPQITVADSLTVEANNVICTRDCGTYVETVAAALPALVTVTTNMNNPGYATMKNILAARDKDITIWDAAALGVDKNCVGMRGSPSVTKRVFEPQETALDTRYFSGGAKEMAEQILNVLMEQQII